MLDNEEARKAEDKSGATSGDVAPYPRETVPGSTMRRKVDTMPDGRYIIYYSWDEDE